MYLPKGYGFCTVLVWKHTVGIDFVVFVVDFMVFEETTGEYERIYRFISKCVGKKEKYANKKYILLALNLKNDDIIS